MKLTSRKQQYILTVEFYQDFNRTRSKAIEPKRRVRNLPRYASETIAPAIDEMLEDPDQMVTILTRNMPPKLYFVRKYNVKLAIKLMDANFSNDSLPCKK